METVYVQHEDLTKDFLCVECPLCGDSYLLDSNDVSNLLYSNNHTIDVTCGFCGETFRICLG